MAAYASALHNVTLSGPTLFGNVLNTAAQMAGQATSNDITKYFVLLIMTVIKKVTILRRALRIVIHFM